MKGKHFHEPHLFVCVGRLLSPPLVFSGPGPCLWHSLCTDELPEGARCTEWLPPFNFLSSQSFGRKQSLSSFLIISACQPEIKRGCPLTAGERKLSFLDVLLLVAGPTGNFYGSHRASQCVVKSVVLWVDFWSVLTVSYLSKLWRTSSFMACGLQAQTQPFQPRRVPRSTQLSSPALSCSSCLSDASSHVWTSSVCMSVCVSVCVILG